MGVDDGEFTQDDGITTKIISLKRSGKMRDRITIRGSKNKEAQPRSWLLYAIMRQGRQTGMARFGLIYLASNVVADEDEQ